MAKRLEGTPLEPQALVFGTGGVPHSATDRSNVGGIERIKELCLGCMEVEFVRQVKMGPDVAKQVGEAGRNAGVRLSEHAPYYINLNSPDPEILKNSKRRLLEAIRIAPLIGAHSVVFHAAFYLSNAREEVYSRVRDALADVLGQLDPDERKVWVRPEVMGRGSQFGTIKEVVRLSNEFDNVLPAFDVAHWHAREGRFNSYEEFLSAFREIEAGLGKRGVENLHIHLSGIKYGKSGEISHLNLADSDLDFRELLRAMRDVGAKGTVICESPNLESDALLLKETYENLS